MIVATEELNNDIIYDCDGLSTLCAPVPNITKPATLYTSLFTVTANMSCPCMNSLVFNENKVRLTL